MKRFLFAVVAALMLAFVSVAFAKGGFSGGGGRGGFSSAPRAPSYSAPRAPTVTTTSPGTRSTTVTSTTTTRSVGGGYYGPGVAYGGLGMGYGYSNGMLTGLLIGNMLHPHNTVVYSGPGSYTNNALLYPDGRVVNSSGQLVGNYANGTFTAVENGPIVAQAVPQQSQAQPVVIKDNTGEIVAFIVVVAFLMFIVLLILL